MSDSKGSPTVSLIEQFSQAIQNVKQRITGYNEQVQQYKQGVNSNADRLRELVDRLRACLEGLRGLKQNHESFVTKLQSIYQNIDTERQRAIEDSSTDEAKKCNDKIQSIYGQFKELESTLGEMETDFSSTIGEQLTALGGVIDELCKEGDGLSSQISSSSAAVGQEIDRLSQKVSSEPLDEVKQVEDTTPEGGRTVFVNSVPSDIWKSAGEPPNVYYFRADGEQFNDGTGMVESSYTHPKDYPSAMQGGWRTTDQLKSLSRTHPIRSLRTTLVKKNKKNKKKTKKKKKTKRKKNTKSKRYKKKKSKKKRR